MNGELPNVQVGFRKGRGTRDQIAKICWIVEKAREFQKSIYFRFIDYARAVMTAAIRDRAALTIGFRIQRRAVDRPLLLTIDAVYNVAHAVIRIVQKLVARIDRTVRRDRRLPHTELAFEARAVVQIRRDL